MGEILLPLIILIILGYGILQRVKVYEVFVEGAKDGLITVFRIAPFLLTMLFAIDLFRKSGAMDLFLRLLRPFAIRMGIPEGILPMVLIKPLSGSGALGVMTDTMKQYGVDSMEGRIAAVMMGSTETILYTLSVYFGGVGIKRTRHSLAAAMAAHIAGCIAAVYACYLFF